MDTMGCLLWNEWEQNQDTTIAAGWRAVASDSDQVLTAFDRGRGYLA